MFTRKFMNNEELLHAVMNPDEPWNETDTNTYTNDVVFAPTSEGYDPYPDLEKLRRLESVGAKIPSFFAKDQYRAPTFTQPPFDEAYSKMNLKETVDQIARKESVEGALSSLFVPQGSTPEEQAKSKNVSALLSEIDNFAAQYRLNKTQVDQLKLNVFSNHLGEYITTKNTLAKQKKDTERKEMLDRARGREEGIDTIADPTAVPEGGAAAGAGDSEMDKAVEEKAGEEIEDGVRKLSEAYERFTVDASRDPQAAVKRAFTRWNVRTWEKAFRLNVKDILGIPDSKYFTEKKVKMVMQFIQTSLGLGNRMRRADAEYAKSVVMGVRDILKGK